MWCSENRSRPVASASRSIARVTASPARMNAIQARSSFGASFRFERVPGIGCVVNELIVASTIGAQRAPTKGTHHGLVHRPISHTGNVLRQTHDGQHGPRAA